MQLIQDLTRVKPALAALPQRIDKGLFVVRVRPHGGPRRGLILLYRLYRRRQRRREVVHRYLLRSDLRLTQDLRDHRPLRLLLLLLSSSYALLCGHPIGEAEDRARESSWKMYLLVRWLHRAHASSRRGLLRLLLALPRRLGLHELHELAHGQISRKRDRIHGCCGDNTASCVASA